MREIEFRGVCNVRNIWVYGSLCDTNEGLLIVRDVHHIDGQDYCLERSDVIPETVGQFTGLKDKNGVKIYEGDIIDVCAMDMGEGYDAFTGTVGFADGAFAVFPRESDVPLYCYTDDVIEIIGNVHEQK